MEQLDSKVGNLFLELGEKPRSTAVRVGKRSVAATGCRPVKVTLASSTAVRQLLINAKQLRQVVKLKSVYLSPDRTPEERVLQRELIKELKTKNSEQSDHHHYIKGGKIVSEKKTGG